MESAVAQTSSADGESLPLFLTLSHSIQKDSNFSRSSRAQSETVNATGLTAGLNKAYGRQVYNLVGQITANRYDRFDFLNFDAKTLQASASSGIGSDWLATINGSHTESQTNQQDNLLGTDPVSNVRKVRDAGLSLQYGVSGRFAIVGTYDTNRLSYDNPLYRFQDANQRSTGLRLVYNASDLLSFGLGPRWVRTTYPNNAGTSSVKDQNLDFSTNWTVTGISRLNLLLSLRDSESRVSSGSRKGNALTGSLGWQFTPRGLTTYGLSMTRTTDADRLSQPLITGVTRTGVITQLADFNTDTLTTTLNASATYAASAKLSASLNLAMTRYEVEDVTRTDTFLNTRQSASQRNSLGFSVGYTPIRSVALNCSLESYRQSEGARRVKNDGRVTGCSARFTID